MAHALQSTSCGVADTKEGDVSDVNEESIDYGELLRVSLRHQKLIYIEGIMIKEEGVSLEDLFDWTKGDIVEALRDIHNNDQNQHQIRAAHRNKFAKIVIDIAKRRTETMKSSNNEAQSPPANMKLLIIGKDEEEAIEAIQNGEEYMKELVNSNKIEESLNGLHANTKQIQTDLHSFCDDIKRRIDQKEKQMNQIIQKVQKHKEKTLMQQAKAAQAAAKTVNAFYSEYKGYFQDESLTKQDRKDKLLHAKQVIENEIEKSKQYKDGMNVHDTNLVLDKKPIDNAIQKCFAVTNTGLNLPKVTGLTFGGSTLNWSAVGPPSDEVIALFVDHDDDEKKTEQSQRTHDTCSIAYQIFYQEQRDDAEWNVIKDLRGKTSYDMTSCVGKHCNAKVVYDINNVLQSPPSDPIHCPMVSLFEYSSDFDRNGIIYFLGSDDGKSDWQNPSEKGIIEIQSTPLGNGSKSIHHFVGREAVHCLAQSKINAWAWFSVDLKGLQVKPTHYTLRHYISNDDYCLRNWDFEGSADGGKEWTIIRQHTNDTSLQGKGASHTWKVDECNAFYSLFRIRMTGKDSGGFGSWSLCCSGFEIYGQLKYIAPDNIEHQSCQIDSTNPVVLESFFVQ
eukprot:687292_1